MTQNAYPHPVKSHDCVPSPDIMGIAHLSSRARASVVSCYLRLRNSGGSNPGLGARGLEPYGNFRGRKKGLEPLVGGSSF
jgi:hypothetical protein